MDPLLALSVLDAGVKRMQGGYSPGIVHYTSDGMHSVWTAVLLLCALSRSRWWVETDKFVRQHYLALRNDVRLHLDVVQTGEADVDGD